MIPTARFVPVLMVAILAAAAVTVAAEPSPRPADALGDRPQSRILSPVGFDTARTSARIPAPRISPRPRLEPRTVRLRTGAVRVGVNIPMHPDSTTSQSEISVAVHPENSDVVLAGANAADLDVLVGSQGWYHTTDGGASWAGSDTLPTHVDLTRYMTDPAVGIDLDGNLFLNAIEFAQDADLFVARSTDGGSSWSSAIVPNSTVDEDKNHFAVDVSRQSPFANNLYTAYTDFATLPAPVVLSRSTDRGASFSSPVSISGSIGSDFAQGINLATGPGGELYAAWSGYDNFPPDSTRLGFNRSTDGGVTWDTARAVRYVHDLRGRLEKGSASVRVNSYPCMAVDRSDGAHRGTLYMVFAEKSPESPDVWLVRSVDGGDTWGAPVRVNQDSSLSDQWFPWIAVDAVTGALYVVYYDSRNFPRNDSAEVYLSTSLDGGETFEDLRVSDVPFLPSPIPGLASGYMGDYIGVAAQGGIVWPAWNDDRTGIHQAYTARLQFFDPSVAVRIVADPESLDFDTVFVGYPEARTLDVRNLGFPDTLHVLDVQIDDAGFSADAATFDLPPGGHRALQVTFSPMATGSNPATLRLISSDPANPEVSVPLAAVALMPPALSLEALTLRDSLGSGDRSTQTIWIGNEGASVLKFGITAEPDLPAAGAQSRTPALRPSAVADGEFPTSWGNDHSLQRSASGAVTSGVQRNTSSLPVAPRDTTLPVVLTDSTGDGGAVDLIRLTGKSRHGILTVGLEFSLDLDPADFGGYLSLDLDRNPATGAVPSFVQVGQDIGCEYEVSFFSLADSSVELVDARTGLTVGVYAAWVAAQRIEFSLPLVDLEDDDGYIDVTGVVGDGIGPTDWFPERGHGTIRGVDWLWATPVSGQVLPHESTAVEVTFAADELYGGAYARALSIASNDPARPDVLLPCTLKVAGVGRIAAGAPALDFGAVYLGFPVSLPLALLNVGTDRLTVSGVTSDQAEFSADVATFSLAPDRDTTVIVTCAPVALGIRSATLSFASDDPDLPIMTVPLTAESRLAPLLQLNPDTVAISVRTGLSDTTSLQIGNAGPGILDWQLVGPSSGSWYSVLPEAGTLAAGEADTVAVDVIATALSDGAHLLSIRLATNDPRSPEAIVPFNVDVIGIAPGDADADFQIDARDVITLVNFIFRDGPPPHPTGGDPDCNSGITLADVFFLIEYIFKSGVQPSCP